MKRKGIIVAILFAFVLSLGGCATGRGKMKDGQMQELRNQISVLEAQVASRDEEINSLREQLLKQDMSEENPMRSMKKKVIPEVKQRPTVKQIQTALINAGYNPGKADGKMGRQTTDAVKAFQRANNLTVDGKVGKLTWESLKEYLYKKVK